MTTSSSMPDPRLAKWIALLMLLSIIFGGLGESYLPGRIIVSNDAAGHRAQHHATPAAVPPRLRHVHGRSNLRHRPRGALLRVAQTGGPYARAIRSISG